MGKEDFQKKDMRKKERRGNERRNKERRAAERRELERRGNERRVGGKGKLCRVGYINKKNGVIKKIMIENKDVINDNRTDIKIINLTPHPVKLIKDGKVIRVWDKPDRDRLPRLEENIAPTVFIDGVPFRNKIYGKCENLPEYKKGVYYIVSGLIASALHREDLIVPNTVRDDQGQIIGCDSFSQILI